MTNVDSLPPELFEQIAGSVPAEALISLRLVDRQCCMKVLKTYAKACYTHRNITLGDVDMLIKSCDVIANKKLAKTIRSITFNLELHAAEEGGLWSVRLEEDFLMWLVLFFGVLKEHGNVGEIRIADMAAVPFEWHKSYAAFMYSAWPVTVVSEALYANEMSVPSIVVGDVNKEEYSQWFLVCASIVESARDHTAFVKLAAFLTTFHLSCWVDFDDKETGDEFMKVLAEAPYLEELQVSVHEGQESYVSRALLKQTFTSLKRLKFRNGFCSWSDIAQFGRRQPALVELSLADFSIYDPRFREPNEFVAQVDGKKSCAENVKHLTGLAKVVTDEETEEWFDESWHN